MNTITHTSADLGDNAGFSMLSASSQRAVWDLAEAFIASGRGRLDSEWLESKFGFGDGDMFNELVDALEAIDEVRAVLDEYPAHDLVYAVASRVVVPALQESGHVELRYVSCAHNPARIARVDGLSNNERTLSHRIVEMTTAQLVEAIASLIDSPQPARVVARESVMSTGLHALVGRRVEVATGSGEDDVLMGTLLAVHPDALSLGGSDEWSGEHLVVVPMSSVRSVRTSQLTADEDDQLSKL
jgi:hypothetical protein